MAVSGEFVCTDCSHNWQVPLGKGRPGACPQCGSASIQRIAQGKELSRFHKGVGRDKGRRWIR